MFIFSFCLFLPDKILDVYVTIIIIVILLIIINIELIIN